MEKTRLRDTFKALDVFVDGEVNLRGEIMTVVIVAMKEMLTRRPNADGTEDGRQGYEKFDAQAKTKYEYKSTATTI